MIKRKFRDIQLIRSGPWHDALKTILNSRPICLFCQPLVIDAGVSQSPIKFIIGR